MSDKVRDISHEMSHTISDTPRAENQDFRFKWFLSDESLFCISISLSFLMRVSRRCTQGDSMSSSRWHLVLI